MKALTLFIGYTDRAALVVLTALGLFAGLIPVSAYYVSRDYEMSVYRYMKVTPADVYYFGGYDSLEKDYASPDSFMTSMKQTPASVIIDGMSVERVAKIPRGQLEAIHSESLWVYFGFNEILGESSDEVEDSLTASRTMDAYEFTFEYRGLTAKTFTYLLRHPRMVLREIGMISHMGTQFIKPSTLLIFIFGELFGVYMICMHFGMNAAGQVVYYTRPAPLKLTMAFLRLFTGSLCEMISGWRINEDVEDIPPDNPVQTEDTDRSDQAEPANEKDESDRCDNDTDG